MRNVYVDNGGTLFIETSPGQLHRLRLDGTISVVGCSQPLAYYLRRDVLKYHSTELPVIHENPYA